MDAGLSFKSAGNRYIGLNPAAGVYGAVARKLQNRIPKRRHFRGRPAHHQKKGKLAESVVAPAAIEMPLRDTAAVGEFALYAGLQCIPGSKYHCEGMYLYQTRGRNNPDQAIWGVLVSADCI